MDEKTFLETLVQRYINNQASAEELEAFFHLLEEGKLDTILQQHISKEAGEDIQEKFRQLPYRRSRRWYENWKAAATIIILLGVGTLMYAYRSKLYEIYAPTQFALIETGKGETRKIVLPDGTTVLLNASSKLKYPQRFSNKREISLLEGEAYFEVQQNDRLPFIVATDAINTRVLGTAFNIRSYKELGSVQITVTQGKVAVQSTLIKPGKKGEEQKVLLPDEQVTMSRNTGILKKTRVNAHHAVGWTTGELIFDNASFADAAVTLGNKYNVNIQFTEQKIKEGHFSAAFAAGEQLTDVLDVICLANNLQYSIKDRDVVIAGNNSSILPAL